MAGDREAPVKVSVVIVTMGASPVLDRCLAAIATGTRAPDEVILVDQSPDGLAGQAERRFRGAAVPFKHLRVPPVGTSRARNIGAREAIGDYVAFTDDDCVPHPGWLAAMLDVAREPGADAASSRVLPLPEEGRGLIGVSLRTSTAELRFEGGGAPQAPWDIGTGASMMFSAERFRALGGFDEEFGPGARFRAAEDIDLFERVMQAGAPVAYTPDAVVYHQMKPRRGWLTRQIPYGYGMGAMIARAPAARRRFLVRRYGSMLARTMATSLRKLAPHQLAESILMGVGFLRGYGAAALRARRAAR